MKIIGTYIGEQDLNIGVRVPVWADVIWDSIQNLQGTPNAYATDETPYGTDGLVLDNSTDSAVPARFVGWVLTPPQQSQTRQAAALYEVTGAAVNVSQWKRDRADQLNQNPCYKQ